MCRGSKPVRKKSFTSKSSRKSSAKKSKSQSSKCFRTSRSFLSRSINFSFKIRSFSISASKSRDPLRILFCGSDDFSVCTLQALHDEHKQNEASIASIDVVCRPGKPIGRGLKTIREVPIASVARALSLNVHQIDTFTKWQPPAPQEAQYGGLNVHPSMLPDFHGPAPLHHTLLSGCRRTGVTLQTLHPKYFDRGTILAQTLYPGFEHQSCTVQDLLAVAAPKGAEMLIQAIRNDIFVSPLKETALTPGQRVLTYARPAPKITSKDREIDWDTWTAEDILRRHTVIGPLWNLIQSGGDAREIAKRIIWSTGFRKVQSEHLKTFLPGHMVIDLSQHRDEATYIQTCDGQILQIDSIKIEGEKEGNPYSKSRRVGLRPERTSLGAFHARLQTGLDKPIHKSLIFRRFDRPRYQTKSSPSLNP